MKLQQKISAKSKAAWIGREVEVLVEGESEETELLWQGRTALHAPEIDGKVLINDFGPHETLVAGTFLSGGDYGVARLRRGGADIGVGGAFTGIDRSIKCNYI